ncbi:phospholipid carrier-dependent glycosyltransferase [Alcanivorax sp. N3-2A]|nr:phospholipid carrier-dependent glycosyltransferase [Alcanivorax sp. N3-2A]
MSARAERGLWILLAVIVLSRLVTMAVLPLTDTSEARYGEIARLMAVSGDWITPWFRERVPFWGKPPLAFWAQAWSIRLFGAGEFGPRFPAWLAQLATLALTGRYAFSLGGRRMALIATLILASMGLSYVACGAVLTDPFLTLGTTAALVGAGLALRGEGRGWGALFFAGLVVGLLAKGPLALVLIGAPLLIQALWSGRWAALRRCLPWRAGIPLTLALSLPWYALAEWKTPGFLDYFIVGEHLRRFLDPGWAGDLYGSAHQRPHGAIWLMTLWATLPWSPLALGWLARRMARRGVRLPADNDLRLLIAAALVPSLFFTFAGNILATYVLPALPFMALLLARQWPAQRSGLLIGLASLVPVLALVAAGWLQLHPQRLRSEKRLVACYRALADTGAASLAYLGEAPFSARYYAREQLTQVPYDNADDNADDNGVARRATPYLAVRHRDLRRLRGADTARATLFSNRRYVLLGPPASGKPPCSD